MLLLRLCTVLSSTLLIEEEEGEDGRGEAMPGWMFCGLVAEVEWFDPVGTFVRPNKVFLLCFGFYSGFKWANYQPNEN